MAKKKSKKKAVRPAQAQAEVEELDVQAEELEEEKTYEVECILDYRLPVSGTPEYFIKWVGYGEADNSWEPLSCLDGCPEILDAFRAGKGEEEQREAAEASAREARATGLDEGVEDGKIEKAPPTPSASPEPRHPSIAPSSSGTSDSEPESASSDQTRYTIRPSRPTPSKKKGKGKKTKGKGKAKKEPVYEGKTKVTRLSAISSDEDSATLDRPSYSDSDELPSDDDDEGDSSFGSRNRRRGTAEGRKTRKLRGVRKAAREMDKEEERLAALAEELSSISRNKSRSSFSRNCETNAFAPSLPPDRIGYRVLPRASTSNKSKPKKIVGFYGSKDGRAGDIPVNPEARTDDENENGAGDGEELFGQAFATSNTRGTNTARRAVPTPSTSTINSARPLRRVQTSAPTPTPTRERPTNVSTSQWLQSSLLNSPRLSQFELFKKNRKKGAAFAAGVVLGWHLEAEEKSARRYANWRTDKKDPVQKANPTPAPPPSNTNTRGRRGKPGLERKEEGPHPAGGGVVIWGPEDDSFEGDETRALWLCVECPQMGGFRIGRSNLGCPPKDEDDHEEDDEERRCKGMSIQEAEEESGRYTRAVFVHRKWRERLEELHGIVELLDRRPRYAPVYLFGTSSEREFLPIVNILLTNYVLMPTFGAIVTGTKPEHSDIDQLIEEQEISDIQVKGLIHPATVARVKGALREVGVEDDPKIREKAIHAVARLPWDAHYSLAADSRTFTLQPLSFSMLVPSPHFPSDSFPCPPDASPSTLFDVGARVPLGEEVDSEKEEVEYIVRTLNAIRNGKVWSSQGHGEEGERRSCRRYCTVVEDDSPWLDPDYEGRRGLLGADFASMSDALMIVRTRIW